MELGFRWSLSNFLTCSFGCLGLFWGVSNLERFAASSNFWETEDRLLQFESFSPEEARNALSSDAAQQLSPCDTRSQRALLLLEMPLAHAALKSGAVGEFDQHVRSIESRTRRVLSCAPRDALAWLVAFGMEIEHGVINPHSFDILAISYEISSNEAWISLRRIVVAIPVILGAPDVIKETVLTEFLNLLRHRFVAIPARSYLNAPAPTRDLLNSRIQMLDPVSQRIFFEELKKFNS